WLDDLSNKTIKSTLSGKTLEVVLQFLTHALEETVVLPCGRKRSCQHVVADDVKCIVPVEFAVPIGRALHVSVCGLFRLLQGVNDDDHASEGEGCQECC